MRAILMTISCLFLVSSAVFSRISLTVYNTDLGLVKESRKIQIRAGISKVSFSNVAAGLIPASVHFSSPEATLIEQNFEYDTVDSRKLMRKFIGRDIVITTRDERVHRGVLLSASGDIVLGGKDNSIHSISGDWISDIDFPNLPDGLFTQPTLVWTLDSHKGGTVETEVSYLTRDISWNAEYIALVSKDDKSLAFTGWANIDNKSGMTYKEAELKLIAGDVRTIRRENTQYDDLHIARAMSGEIPQQQFKQQPLYEYNIYTLQRPSTIEDKQIKQISLFPAASVDNLIKEYRYNASTTSSKVSVSLKFDNDDSNNLGVALPKGIIRVYKLSTEENNEFIGEDRIDHIPNNEVVSINTGYTSEIVGEKTIKDSQRKGRSRTRVVEIKVRNRKNEAVKVFVSDYLEYNESIIDALPLNYTKIDHNHVEWLIDLSPAQEKTVTYTAHREN